MKPLSPASYSREWGNRIVQQLIEKYTRATEIAGVLLGINRVNLVTYLIYRDELFPQIRDFIKRVDKIITYADPPLSMSEIYYIMSKYYPSKQSNRIGERLTQYESEITTKEQVKEGGELEATADDSPPSLFLSPKVVNDGYGPQLLFQFI